MSEFKDLGLFIDSKLSFVKYISTITAKATAALEFVKRFCYDITYVLTIKTSYFSLVRSHQYYSVVWLPFYGVHTNKIESVQMQFTMLALKEYSNVNNNFKITPYEITTCETQHEQPEPHKNECFINISVSDSLNGNKTVLLSGGCWKLMNEVDNFV